MIPGRPSSLVNGVEFTVFEGVGDSRLFLVHTKEEWQAFYDLLMKQTLVACDTETSGFNYYADDHIVGMSFGWGDHHHFYIPVRHEFSELGGEPLPQLDFEEIKPDLQAFFSQEHVFTMWQNAKFDLKFYKADGIDVKTPFHDTRILWQLYNENAPGALKTIASGWFDTDLGIWRKGIVGKEASAKEKEVSRWRYSESRARKKVYNEEVKAKVLLLRQDPANQHLSLAEIKTIAKGLLAGHPYATVAKSDIHYGMVPIDLMCEYAGLDTFLTWKVYEYVTHRLPLKGKTLDLYINELKLSKALQDAEETGVPVSREYLISLGEQLDQTIAQYEDKVKTQLALPELNLGSNAQLSVAFSMYGIPLTQKTDSASKCDACKEGTCNSHYAVNKKALGKLAGKYPVIDDLLSFRAAQKLKSTYVDGILEKLTDDNVLHCSFNQNVTTGRMSSGNPNLQNIPGKDKSIRKAFVNLGDDWVFVFMDYSQVEVRLTAHFSEDPLLLDAYEKGQDIHTRTMCEMFGYSYDEVYDVLKVHENPDHPMYNTWNSLRSASKTINFGIIYGVGAQGLSEQIPRPALYKDLSEEEWVKVCQGYLDSYLEKYIGVKRFINKTNRLIAKEAKIENYFGRVRHLPHAHATRILKDPTRRWQEAKAKRQGVNFLVQSTAADVFKIAIVRVYDLLKGKKSRVVNFVHDELQIQLHKTEMDLIPEIKKRMEDFDFLVPLLIDIEYSTTNWAEKRSL